MQLKHFDEALKLRRKALAEDDSEVANALSDCAISMLGKRVPTLKLRMICFYGLQKLTNQKLEATNKQRSCILDNSMFVSPTRLWRTRQNLYLHREQALHYVKADFGEDCRVGREAKPMGICICI